MCTSRGCSRWCGTRRWSVGWAASTRPIASTKTSTPPRGCCSTDDAGLYELGPHLHEPQRRAAAQRFALAGVFETGAFVEPRRAVVAHRDRQFDLRRTAFASPFADRVDERGADTGAARVWVDPQRVEMAQRAVE